MSVKWSWCSNLNRWDLFLCNALYVAWRRKAEHSVTFVAAICARRLFVVNTLTVFLSFCYIYKDFVRQLKVFPPSFCHFCACKMSPGWGHLITWMDPSVRHLNGILARVGGNLNKKFQKSQMTGGVARGGHVEASIWPIHNEQEICPPFWKSPMYDVTSHWQWSVNQKRPLPRTVAFYRNHDRDKGGTIRKVMGRVGNFWAAGIFFRYQIPCRNFFQALAWIFLRVNWRSRHWREQLWCGCSDLTHLSERRGTTDTLFFLYIRIYFIRISRLKFGEILRIFWE